MTLTRQAIVALMAVLLGPCPPAGAQQGKTGKLKGTVTEVQPDGSTTPIRGGVIHVSVYLDRLPLLIPCMKDTPTNKDGGFSLDVPADSGLVVIFLDSRDLPQYHSTEYRTRVNAGATNNSDPTLQPLSTPMTAPALGGQARWLSRVVEADLNDKRSRAEERRKFGPYLEYLVGAALEFPGDFRLNAALAASADLLRDPPLAFGHDPGTLYTQGHKGELVRLDVKGGGPAWNTDTTAPRLGGLAVLADGRVAQMTAKEVLLWPPAQQRPEKPIGRLAPEKGVPVAVAAAPKGNRMAVADDLGRVALFAADGPKFFRGPVLETGPAVIRALAFSPDGTTLAAVNLAGEIFVWDAGTGGLRLRVPADRESAFANAVAFSPNGRQLAVTNGLTRPGVVRFVDIESKKTVWARHLPEEGGGAAGVVVTREGTVVTTGIRSGALFAFGAATGKPFAQGPATRGAVALSPDGALLGFVDSAGRPQIAPERTLIQP
jgi:hypothetical protein